MDKKAQKEAEEFLIKFKEAQSADDLIGLWDYEEVLEAFVGFLKTKPSIKICDCAKQDKVFIPFCADCGGSINE